MRVAFIQLLLLAFLAGNAQTINGKVAGLQKEFVSNAVIVLQNADSSFVSATTTDSLGNFCLQINSTNGMVVIQHLAYETQTIDFTNGDYSALKNITLIDKTTQLDDIVVKAHTPIVMVKDNALVYNAKYIAERKAVNNAFELLKYTPGVTTRSDGISLAGASQLTVIVDGKATMLSTSEIVEVLKSMSASSIGNIEVMYKAPAKYGVRGALINIVTDKRKKKSPLEAELATEYQQKFYASGNTRANIAYRSEKLDIDVLAKALHQKIRNDITDYSINKFNDIQTIIDQHSTSGQTNDGNAIRTSINYNFNEDNSLSMMYYGKFSKYFNPIKSETNFLYHTGGKNIVNSTNDEDNHNYLHNVNLKGVFGGASITADYVSFFDKTESDYKDFETDNITTDYQNNSTMDIDQLKLLASYDWELSDIWQMSVGTQETMTNSKTKISYLFPEKNLYVLDPTNCSDNLQKEQRFSVFAESFNAVFDSVQLDFTLELEHFKSVYDENGTKSTLWNEWRVYPSLSVTWPLKQDVIQMSVTTYKNYPTYWDLSPHTTQMNPYKYIVGNPLLKPSTCYDMSLAYVLRKTHTIEAYCYYEKDCLAKMPYQNVEELRIYYQTVNFDYNLTCGFGGEAQFEIGFWEPTMGGYLIYMREKMSDFHGLFFDRDDFLFSLEMDNTFTVSKERPNLKFTLDAFYMSKTIQGIYDINSIYDVAIGMKWNILKNLYFSAKWSNTLEHDEPYPAKVKFYDQYNEFNHKQYNCFNASLVWRIGGFKAKDIEITDTKRMQR